MIAVAFGTINVVGGFLVTDRMLEMFKGKKELVEAAEEARRVITATLRHDRDFTYVLYIVAF